MDRRRFLSLLAVATGAVASALVAVPFVGELLSPLRGRGGGAGPGEAFPVGRLDESPVGQPRRVTFPVTWQDGWTQSTQDEAAWILRTDASHVRAFSAICP